MKWYILASLESFLSSHETKVCIGNCGTAPQKEERSLVARRQFMNLRDLTRNFRRKVSSVFNYTSSHEDMRSEGIALCILKLALHGGA
jgi:hypothetical protein